MESCGGGGGGTSSICFMGGLGDHNNNNNSNNSNNTLCPNPLMMMMLPPAGSGENTTHHNNNHNLFFPLPSIPVPPNCSNNHNQHHEDFQRHPASSPMMVDDQNNNNQHQQGYYFMENNNNAISSSVKAKIMAHPHYHRLLSAYVNCQKIGAPPEVVGRLQEAFEAAASIGGGSNKSCVGEDPSLDQFMEAYCEMLIKYEQELSKPFKEAMLFLSRIESQFKAITLASSSDSGMRGDGVDKNVSSEEDVDVNNAFIDPQAEDHELKGQLLRKYSGYLGSLKQEFLKKRKKGKLPKEARQQLLEWWTRHYKWPYPSESQKLALAESTGLDQKQINNWFINQRKRHWKPSEDMQFVVMDAAHPHYYLDNVMANPFSMDVSPSIL